MTSPGGGNINLATLWLPVSAETSKIAPQMRAAGEEGAKHFAAAFTGQNVGSNIGAQIGAGLLQGFQRSGAASQLSGLMGGISLGTLGIASAIAGVVVGAEKLTTALVHVGEEFEDIERSVMLFTTATGPALDELKDHADQLASTLDTTIKNVGADMSMLATRLHMEAGAELDQLTRHVEELSDRFGRLNVSALAGAFIQFGISGKDADDTLSMLVETARNAGVSLPTLINEFAQGGPALQEFGLNANEAANMLAKLEAQGLNGAQAATVLARAEKAAAEQHKALPEFIQDEINAINEYHAAGNDAAANQEAFLAFGIRNWPLATKAAQAYVDAIKEGSDANRADSQTTDKLIEDTESLGNKFERLYNNVKKFAEYDLGGGKLIRGLRTLLDMVNDLFEEPGIHSGYINPDRPHTSPDTLLMPSTTPSTAPQVPSLIPMPPPSSGPPASTTPPSIIPTTPQTGPVSPGMTVPIPGMTIAPSSFGAGSNEGLQNYTLNAKGWISAQFPQVTDIGGWRPPDGYNEHSSGQAIDVMIPGGTSNVAYGNEVAAYALALPGVDYVLWQQRQWYPDGRSVPMNDRGSPTQNHMDHVHVHTTGGGFPSVLSTGTLSGGGPARVSLADYHRGGGGGGGGLGGPGTGGGSALGPGGSPYIPGTGETEAQARARQRAVEDAQERLSDANDRVGEYTERVKETADALAKAKEGLNGLKPGTLDYDNQMKEVTKAEKAHDNAVKDLAKALKSQKRAGEDLTEAQTKQQEEAQKPAKATTRSGQSTADALWSQLGGGLLKGIGEELGFGDIFGKPPWEWGIWKLGAGLASWGLGTANAWGDMLSGQTQGNTLQLGGGGPGLGMSAGGLPGVKSFITPVSNAPNLKTAVPADSLPPGAHPAVAGHVSYDQSINIHNPTVADPQGLQNSMREEQNSRFHTATGSLPAPAGV